MGCGQSYEARLIENEKANSAQFDAQTAMREADKATSDLEKTTTFKETKDVHDFARKARDDAWKAINKCEEVIADGNSNPRAAWPPLCFRRCTPAVCVGSSGLELS